MVIGVFAQRNGPESTGVHNLETTIAERTALCELTHEFTAPNPMPQGRPIQIVRHVKIPDEIGFDGQVLLKTEDDFLRFVGTNNRRYVRWNNVNFARQSVLVFAKRNCVAATDIRIKSIECDGIKLILHVSEYCGTIRPAVVRTGWDAVVIGKSLSATEICVKIDPIPN